MTQVQNLRQQLEIANDRLLEIEADAATSRIELHTLTQHIQTKANEQLRSVSEELRSTKTLVERYKGNWLREKRKQHELSSSVATNTNYVVIGGNTANVKNNEINMVAENVTSATATTIPSWGMGSLLGNFNGEELRKVTPRVCSDNNVDNIDIGGDKEYNNDTTDDNVRGGGFDDNIDMYDNDNVDDSNSRIPTSFSGKKRKSSSSINHSASSGVLLNFTNHHNKTMSAAAQVVESSNNSVRIRIVMQLLHHDEMGCYYHHDHQYKIPSPNLQPLPSCGDKIEVETQKYVRSILCHMISTNESPQHSGTIDCNLSISGLLHILVVRFNMLFHHITDGQDGLSLDNNNPITESCMLHAAATTDSSSSRGKDTIDSYPKMILVTNANESAFEKQMMYESISWNAALYLLSVIHDILLLGVNTREDVRLWIYQSRDQLCNNNNNNSDARTSSSSVHDGDAVSADMHPRIEGLAFPGRIPGRRRNDYDRKEALWTANCRSKSPIDQQRRRLSDWDPLTMIPTFNLFFELIVGLMKGSIFDHSCSSRGSDYSDSESDQALVAQLIQLKAIDLVSTLMSDAPPHDHAAASDNHVHPTPYLWKFWFDSLIPTTQSSMMPTSDFVPTVGDFFSPWEKREDNNCNNNQSGRRHSTMLLVHSTPNEQYKRGTEKIGRTGSKQPRDDVASSREINTGNLHHLQLSIVIKDRILRLITQFVLSSSSVNQNLYRVVDESNMTSLAKRILAAILDHMDGFILQYLSDGILSSSSDCDPKSSTTDQCLRLCLCCIQFLLVMSRSNEGIRLLRVQMRLETEEDEASCWSQSSIGCMTMVLNGALTFAMRIDDGMEGSQNQPDGVAHALTLIVERCIAFFKALLLFVEHQRESSSKAATFLVLTSEHRTIFQSCCQRILAHQSPKTVLDPPRLLHFSKELKSDVCYLYEELVLDAEKEIGN
jgi:hypothetical protein